VNGCYSKCKSRKRVYKTDLKACIVEPTTTPDKLEEKLEEQPVAPKPHEFDFTNTSEDLPKR
jgi:hypothetical protein